MPPNCVKSIKEIPGETTKPKEVEGGIERQKTVVVSSSARLYEEEMEKHCKSLTKWTPKSNLSTCLCSHCRKDYESFIRAWHLEHVFTAPQNLQIHHWKLNATSSMQKFPAVDEILRSTLRSFADRVWGPSGAQQCPPHGAKATISGWGRHQCPWTCLLAPALTLYMLALHLCSKMAAELICLVLNPFVCLNQLQLCCISTLALCPNTQLLYLLDSRPGHTVKVGVNLSEDLWGMLYYCIYCWDVD